MKFLSGPVFIAKLIICLLFVFLGIYFALYNKQLVKFDLIFLQIPQINLGLLSVMLLLCGFILGFVASLPIIGKSKQKNSKSKSLIKEQVDK